ncbi:sugar phosphate isomerase/epimerase [Acidobacteria bacterium AH-259-A15]|nr:sugar phosphate isomerase/epimerase [Acidobacteria bacterium AH-259-A15]
MMKSDTGISRRGFLRTSGLGLSGALIGSSAVLSSCGDIEKEVTQAAAPAQTVASGYGPFKMGFQSYSLRHFSASDDFLREAKKLELRYVELYRGHLDPSATPAQISETRERLAAAGIQANAFGVERFTSEHGKNQALFEFGKTLRVTNLSANPTRDAFSSLNKLVEQYDIRIAIHNHGPEDDTWRLPEWILEAVKDLDARIGACADLGHFIRAGVNPVEAIEMLGSRVLGVHFKDFDAQGNDVVLGQGQLDVAKALDALKKVGFEGPLSLEFEGDKENPVPKMLQCLAAIREGVRA